tara:strand:+ start:3798 stop:4373 length:576 start_codon:yes stop_codon:yes gene_type:complete
MKYQKSIEKLKNLPFKNWEYCGPGLGHQNRLDTSGFEKTIWKRINKYFLPDSAVLDVGSGSGRFSKLFSEHVKSVRAIDNYVPFKESSMRPNITFSNHGIENFKESGFDVVFLFGVFYMFGYPQNVDIFSKLYETVGDNGHLIIIESANNEMIRYDLEKYAAAHGGEVVDTFLQCCEESWEHRTTVIKKGE